MDDADRSETDPSAIIPILVISLPDSTDRRERIAERLDALSLPFEFVNAVDGRLRIPEELEQLVDRQKARGARGVGPMCDAEFGCALSHILACRAVAERNLPYSLILEDDATPLPDLPEYLRGRHFENAEVTCLYYSRASVRSRSAVACFGEYQSFECFPHSDMPGMVGYIVSTEAARHIADNAVPVDREADHFTCYEHFKKRGQWRVVHPRLIDHPHITADTGPSIINAHGRTERRKLKRRFLGIYVPPMRYIAHSWLRSLLAPVNGLRKLKK